MAVENRGISDFPTTTAVLATTLLLLSTVAPESTSGYDSEKCTASELGRAILKDFSYTQDLQTAHKTIVSAINELLVYAQNIAPEYDEDAGTYQVDDYCIESGQLYKCNTAISTPEVFDSSKWDSTTIMQEIQGGSI